MFADKTSNIYKMPLHNYNKVLKENITRTYKHAPLKLDASINFEAKLRASKLAVTDCIKRFAKTPAYITLKNHKENFDASTPFRLTNPCKSQIRKVSKRLLKGLNNDLLAILNINH